MSFLQLRHQLRRLFFVKVIFLIDLTFENITQSRCYFALVRPIEIKYVRPFAYTSLAFRHNRLTCRGFFAERLGFDQILSDSNDEHPLAILWYPADFAVA